MDKINYKNYRYVMIALLLCSVITAFMSFMTVGGTGVSIFKLLRISNLDFLDMDSQYTLHRFAIAGILFMIMPIIESIVLLISDRIYTLIFGCASVVLNVLMGAILLHKFLKTIGQFWMMSYLAEIKIAPIIIWVLIYILAAAATAVMLWWYFRQDVKQNIYKESEGVIIDGLFRRNRQKQQQPEFNGAFVCDAGLYRGKAFALLPDETVSFGGSDRNDIFIAEADDEATYCTACFDAVRGEYQITPRLSSGVFLESGQPLGKDRVYCLPRGHKIIIANMGNIFELA